MFSHKQIYEYISLSFDWISKIYSNGCLSENLCQKKCSAKAWRVRSIQSRKKMRLSFQWQAKIEKEWVLLTFRERMKFTYFLFIINKKMEKLLSDCRSIMKTKKKAREEEKRPVDSNLNSIIKCTCVFAYAARVRLSFLVWKLEIYFDTVNDVYSINTHTIGASETGRKRLTNNNTVRIQTHYYYASKEMFIERSDEGRKPMVICHFVVRTFFVRSCP